MSLLFAAVAQLPSLSSAAFFSFLTVFISFLIVFISFLTVFIPLYPDTSLFWCVTSLRTELRSLRLTLATEKRVSFRLHQAFAGPFLHSLNTLLYSRAVNYISGDAVRFVSHPKLTGARLLYLPGGETAVNKSDGWVDTLFAAQHTHPGFVAVLHLKKKQAPTPSIAYTVYTYYIPTQPPMLRRPCKPNRFIDVSIVTC